MSSKCRNFRALKGRTRKGLRLSKKKETQRRVRGSWHELVRDTVLEWEMEAERTQDVSFVVTKTMNCLLGQPQADQKRSRTCQPQLKGNWPARPAK